MLGGALVATALGGASCDTNNSNIATGGTGGTFSSTGGSGGGTSDAGSNVRVFDVQLSGAQEVPVNQSLATASVTVTLDTMTGTVTVTGSFTGLTSSAMQAAIQGPASVGGNAAVLFPLTVPAATAGTVSGNGMMTMPQMNDMISGMTYVNISSMQYPDGEIRAQIIP